MRRVAIVLGYVWRGVFVGGFVGLAFGELGVSIGAWSSIPLSHWFLAFTFALIVVMLAVQVWVNSKLRIIVKSCAEIRKQYDAFQRAVQQAERKGPPSA